MVGISIFLLVVVGSIGYWFWMRKDDYMLILVEEDGELEGEEYVWVFEDELDISCDLSRCCKNCLCISWWCGCYGVEMLVEDGMRIRCRGIMICFCY